LFSNLKRCSLNAHQLINNKKIYKKFIKYLTEEVL